MNTTRKDGMEFETRGDGVLCCCAMNRQLGVVRYKLAGFEDGPDADGPTIDVGRHDPNYVSVRYCPFCGHDFGAAS